MLLACNPPLRLTAVISILSSFLERMADMILSSNLHALIMNPEFTDVRPACYTYLLFTIIAVFIFILEIADFGIIMKNNKENYWLCLISKSLRMMLVEITLPACLLVIFSKAPTLAQPTLMVSAIKLIDLIWNVVAFKSLHACWICRPLDKELGTFYDDRFKVCLAEFNSRWLLIAVVNFCHVVAICLVTAALVLSGTDSAGLFITTDTTE